MNIEDRVRDVLRTHAQASPSRDALERILAGVSNLPDSGVATMGGSRSFVPAPEPRKRLAAGILAALVAVAGVGLVVVAFKGHPSPHSTPGVPPIGEAVHSNGDIWAEVGGGEAGIAISRVDPVTGHTSILWTDSRFPSSTGTPGDGVNQAAIGGDYAFSPDGSHAVFTTYGYDPNGKPYGTELFVMDANGTNVRQLTHDHAVDGFPAWSPDGRTIVYASYRGSGFIPGCLGGSDCPADLYTIDAAGGTPTRLTDTSVGEAWPSWSADGARIAFSTVNADGTGTIDVMNADGTGRIPLTADSGEFVEFPRWSPDGSVIAFQKSQQTTMQLWTVRPDGSDARKVLDMKGDTSGHITWSPDGQQLAFSNVVGANGESELWLTDLSGHAHRLATWPHYGISPIAWRPVSAPPSPSAATGPPPPPGLTGSLVFAVGPQGSSELFRYDSATGDVTDLGPGRDPAISPDGTQVAFRVGNAGRPGGNPTQIGIMSIDGGRARMLDLPASLGLEPQGSGAPVWSPDGTQLAFAGFSGLYAMPSNGGDPRLVTHASADDPLGCYDLEPAWSPDGSTLVFAVRCGGGNEGIWSVNLDGSNRRQIAAPTPGGVIDYRYPSWSPDGATLLFYGVAKDNGYTYDSYMMDRSGSVTRLPRSECGQPAWVSNGESIACPTLGGIHVVRTSGSEVAALKPFPGELVSSVAWFSESGGAS